MRRVKVMTFLSALILALTFTLQIASAQDQTASPSNPGPGQPAANPGARHATDMAFDKWLRKNPDSAAEIRKDPSLLNNPDYLAKHPDLQGFMNDHPEFKSAVAKNPNKVVRMTAHNQRKAAHEHKERQEMNNNQTPQ